jgi:hypothetical protein
MTWLAYTAVTIAGALLLAFVVALGIAIWGTATEDPRSGHE